MRDLGNDLGVIRMAVADAGGLLEPDAAEHATAVLRQVERRLGFLGQTIVVALAGGTGSGKSSLLNAIAGEQVVPAGVLRPTTDHAVAWIPDGAETGLLSLLADLEITDIRFQTSLRQVALIDLPDVDSVEVANRQLVDRLVPRVDAVIWVLDPTKYNDAVVHESYLRPMRAHADQFLVVLNQIDRLTEDERGDVLDDLRATLDADGLGRVPVVAVAADPPSGLPQELDVLLGLVDERFTAKQTALAKLRVDLDEIVVDLRLVAGLDLDLPPRDAVFDAAAEQIARGIIDDPEVGRAGDIGAQVAARAASGPLGVVLGALRGSMVGRAFGLRSDAPIERTLLTSTARPMSRLGPAIQLQTWITDVSVASPSALGRRIRAAAGDLDEVVRGVGSEARAAVDGDLSVDRRTWWTLVGLVRTLLAVTVIGAGVAIWTDPGLLRPGRLPVPALVVVIAVIAVILLGKVVRSSGRAAGEAVALAHRDTLMRAARESLDFRLGRPLDDELAVRTRLHAALETLNTDGAASGS